MTPRTPKSVAERETRVAPRIVRTVELVVPDGLAAERGGADQDRGEVVCILRAGELLAHALEDLARVRADAEGVHVGRLGQPLLVEARRVDGLLRVHAVVDHVDDG